MIMINIHARAVTIDFKQSEIILDKPNSGTLNRTFMTVPYTDRIGGAQSRNSVCVVFFSI